MLCMLPQTGFLFHQPVDSSAALLLKWPFNLIGRLVHIVVDLVIGLIVHCILHTGKRRLTLLCTVKLRSVLTLQNYVSW